MILSPEGGYAYRRPVPTVKELFAAIDQFCEEHCSGSRAEFEDECFCVTIKRKEPKDAETTIAEC